MEIMLLIIVFLLLLLCMGMAFCAGYCLHTKWPKTEKPSRTAEPRPEQQEKQEQIKRELENFWKYNGSSQIPGESKTR